MTATTITYAVEPDLDIDDFIDVLRRSKLSERRPVDNRERLEQMLRHADVIVTARNDDGLLVGVARAITDFHYSTLLSDLAVDEAYQRQGIGRRLVAETHAACSEQTALILHAAPVAVDYYRRIGMEPYTNCWRIPRAE